MIQVRNISKQYKTGEFVQKALDDVSLSLRDNEFVAILGPSGSGKTTLLNVLGGLDRYDSGDLIINGTSTKEYKDRDWDAYRNHSVGFIFQSYNLIPHQSVLANVELALTIAGVSKAERTKRAKEALERVGLGEHINKKPSQLSGGQMQRVAIARALINEPTVLLADEPTGALDSETSVAVMDLLKDVAKDRLVVMVTHNPELAETYANRIVELKDGRITNDTNPYDPEEAEELDTKRLGKASMSFLTALGLSFNNLKTKLRRTLLVSFAGSIGIIGIALILSLSNGMNRYMDNIQRDTLSEYPVELSRSSLDMSILSPDNTAVLDSILNKDAEVKESQTLVYWLSAVNTNDLKSFKVYLDKNRKELDKYAQNVEYRYDITPNIYLPDTEKPRRVNPNDSFSSIGFFSNAMMSGMTNVFSQMPESRSFYERQYEVKEGHWPAKYDELVLVLSSEGWISDITLYSLGMKDSDKLDALINTYMDGGKVEVKEKGSTFEYKDFLGLEFKLLDNSQLYRYDEEMKVWTDKSKDEELVKELLKNGETLKIVGVVQSKADSSVELLASGINYLPELTMHMIDLAKDSEIVKAQLETPEINVLTGKEFGEEDSGIPDIMSMFSINTAALQNAFTIDPNYDMSSVSDEEMAALLDEADVDVSPEKVSALLDNLLTSYLKYSAGNPNTDYANLSDAMQSYLATDEARAIVLDDLNEIITESGADVITADRMAKMITNVMAGYTQYAIANPGADLTAYLQTPEGRQLLQQETNAVLDDLSDVITEEDTQKILNDLMAGYETYAKKNGKPVPSMFSDSFSEYLQTETARAIITDGVSQMVDSSDPATSEALSRIMQDFMANAVSFDESAFANAFGMNMEEENLRDIMSTFLSGSSSDLVSNLALFGYADLEDPDEIIIYPKNFESKTGVIDFIDEYNEKVSQEKQIHHSDMVGTIMSSVTKIINAISYVLVAFVAVSLIVSSIMIGVITYISVLERKKEIGILRAVGASKRNIASVFNAETFIIGALSGIIGITLGELGLIPLNYLIHKLSNQPDLSAYLPVLTAAGLVALSIVLTLIGGLIPSRSAAKSDPVAALRTE
ncbi:MAG: ABC transporter ATP-binding protein/permease [Clostridia bacterium]|nr:ABC transporter ATP-binding protein/permease [Clostridia bacterium]